jgi:uncharacterized membrane protein
MSQVVLLILFVVGLASSFWLGRTLAKSQQANEDLQAALDFKRRLEEAQKKIDLMEKNFADFKERVRVAEPSQLAELLKEALLGHPNQG